jgi:SSS family solute:Na+ symporter
MSFSTLLFKDGFMEFLHSPLHLNLTIVVGTTIIFLIGFLLSTLFARPLTVDDGL